ncbi:MAG: hypothetical protein AB7D39_19580 [Pseudodesulfovibrio sp.]|uniref:hypothetical protein n=1 Tax=Pseudodesulfovibrio sp. TaxID=2035812 RepID=UPI003D10843B
MLDREYIDYLKHRHAELLTNPIPGWKFGISLVGTIVSLGAFARLLHDDPVMGAIAVIGLGLGIWGWREELLAKQELRHIERELRDLE